VQRQLTDGARSNDDGNSSLSQALNESLELLLFSFGVVEQLVSVLDQDCTLGLSLLHFDGSVENGDLCFLD